ncbi:MAG: hydratase, partial [Deltaproteobacteria bacterium]|nr:hydratase [Deltaproteobacteria bacterium]
MDFGAEQVIGQESMLTIAAVQFEPVLGETDSNREKLLALIGKAFDQNAGLIVTPECSSSGYVFNNRREALACAEPVPGGPTVTALEKAASQGSGYIVSGLIEKDGDALYNTAVLIGPEGYIGKYRKTHLWDVDNTLYEPGNLGFPVFKLPFGRVGLSICYDNWFPEVSRIYAAQGVDIICHPTNWVLVPGLAEPAYPAWAYLTLVQAHTNGLFMVCADRIGVERGVTFGGSSCICGLPGFIQGPASADQEEVIVAQVNVI